MHAEFLHIYGPISIQWYGLMIFIAILVFMYAFLKNSQRPKLISTDQFFDLMSLGIIAGIVGARILFLLTNRTEVHSFKDCLALWDGGLSVLGAIVGVLLMVPFYLKAKKIDVLKLLDLVAVYAPLLQSISRIGCFLAGCCYGSVTSVWWAIKCTQSCEVGAYVHPTQLYSAAILFLIFIFMRFVGMPFFKKPGQLMMLYLILECGERFVVDFWRGDREFLANTGSWGIFSIHQYIALGISVIAMIFMIWITVRARQKNESV